MALNTETKFGLTFGQIITSIGLLGTMIIAFANIKMDIATLYERVNKNEVMFNIHVDQNNIQFEKLYKENREDHQIIMDKLDKLYLLK
mgnify:CR=1 FL=1|jgi:adenylate kinase